MDSTTVSIARLFGSLVIFTSLTLAPVEGSAQELPVAHGIVMTGQIPIPVEGLAPVVFQDDRLRTMVAELEQLSPTAAKMLATIRRSGIPLVFGTFPDVADEMRHEYSSWDPERRTAAGFMAPLVRVGERFSGDLTTVKILVAVNLNMLDGVFEGAEAMVDEPVRWDEIQRLETLAVLAHELVHAYGLAARGGDPRNGCHDPEPHERAADSCVMIGENILRREIGAPLDWGYGFPSLESLAERYAQQEAQRAGLAEMARLRLLPDGIRLTLP
jgi:hypothetical protein